MATQQVATCRVCYRSFKLITSIQLKNQITTSKIGCTLSICGDGVCKECLETFLDLRLKKVKQGSIAKFFPMHSPCCSTPVTEAHVSASFLWIVSGSLQSRYNQQLLIGKGIVVSLLTGELKHRRAWNLA